MSIDRPGPGPDEMSPRDVLTEEMKRENVSRLESLEYPDEQMAAQLILVALGEQPAIDLWFSESDPSLDAFARTARDAGLFVAKCVREQPSGRNVTILCIARTAEEAEELRLLSAEPGVRTRHEEYARLMGFPQTAIDAFLDRTPKIPWKDAPAELRDLSVFFEMVHSKDHWKEEFALRRKWCDLVKRYAPKLYESILKKRSA